MSPLERRLAALREAWRAEHGIDLPAAALAQAAEIGAELERAACMEAFVTRHVAAATKRRRS